MTVTRRVSSTGLILALVCAAQFMVILDSAIVNVALPTVQRDLGFAAPELAWVVNGYLLTFAGFMLLGGRAADLFGQRRMLIAGLLVFAAASVVGGLATAPGVLIAARIVQGTGAAMLAPATLAVINTHFTAASERARAFGAWSAAGGVGGMAGAVAGGAITTGLSWRWVFLINLPIGAVLVAVAALVLPAADRRERESLDLVGALSVTAGLAALIYSVMQSADSGWAAARVTRPILAAFVLIGIFVVVEARVAPRPMLPLRLFRSRVVAVDNVLLVLFGGIAIAMWYFSALLLQNVLHYSALRAGLGQTPAAVTFVVVARMAAARLPRTGARPLLLAGCAFLVAGFGWLSGAGGQTGYVGGILGPTLLVGIGIGLVFPTLMATATHGVPAGDAGVAGGLASTANQVGGSIGLAVLATVAGSDGSGYGRVFFVAAGIGVAIAAAGLLLPRRARH
ncbi:MAG TPA: MFS transporter [Mycobacteriales bacterium]|nr:MFS transporter [Mycobacteriales bacterium]